MTTGTREIFKYSAFNGFHLGLLDDKDSLDMLLDDKSKLPLIILNQPVLL